MNKQPGLTSVDMDVLIFLSEHHFLTISQLLRLRSLRSTSLTSEQERMKRLTDHEYVLRVALPHSGKGQPAYVYTLATKGQRELESIGLMFSSSRVRKSEVQQRKLPLVHTLQTNDFLIAARLLPRAVPAIELTEFRHDLDLQRNPARIEVRRGVRVETVSVVPDGWLSFQMSVPGRTKPRKRCIVLELDRGTIKNPTVFKDKLLSLFYYCISEEYKQMFGTDLAQVAFACTAGGIGRVEKMLTWCEQELQLRDLVSEAPLYKFAALPGELDPKTLFCSDMWVSPFSDEEVSPLLWRID